MKTIKNFIHSRKPLHVFLKISLSAFILLILLLLTIQILFPLPVNKLHAPASVSVYDQNNKLLRAFTASDSMWRIYSEIDDISPRLSMAVINYEDRFFRYHLGINPVSIIRAALTNIKVRRIVCGGSTITMQVARMMEPKPRTFKNKLIEAIRAFQLEISYNKDEILNFYFNMAPYGGNIVGSAAASYFYFNKDQKSLSLGEAALLAAIPNSPTVLRPDAPKSMAEKGRKKVLKRLLDKKKINVSQYEEALAEPIPDKRYPMPFKAPHLARDLKAMYPGFSKIITTIDHNIQIMARDILKDHLIPLKKHGITNGSVVVMDTKTRKVLALVGSADFFDKSSCGQVNGAISPRSPGSALKPFAYALALDRGLISPESVLSDVPVDYSGYKPVNYDGQFRGIVTARDALRFSLNVPAVNLVAQIKQMQPVYTGEVEYSNDIYSFLKNAGVSTLTKPVEHYGLSIILGGCGIKLLEMTNLYAGLANMGEFAPYCLRIDDTKNTHKTLLLSKGAAFIITEMLAEVKRPDLPACWESAVNLPKVAWKTGTSYGHKDAWSIGYSPQFTIGVWIGNFKPVGSPAIVGAEAAAPVLFDLFNALSKQRKSTWYTQPLKVNRRDVCTLSGMVMSEHCPHGKGEYYIPGVSPGEKCSIHQVFAIDKETGARLCSHCRIGRDYEMKVFELWPPRIATWLERSGMAVDNIPEHFPGCTSLIAGSGPVIHSPSANCEYTIRPGVDIEYQKILLEASVSNDTDKIFWFLDSEMIYHGTPVEKVFLKPVPGKHSLICMDDQGRSSEMTLVIK
ncbi:penicillin-binding protein 1C [Candidatus Poribacteria bacterium]|nr:penicillin-binding protein 1C [Candidatus Poribacteria bacterium]